jgi:hypothetical protein
MKVRFPATTIGENMSEDSKEARINVEDLPRGEKELTPEEAKEVKGGIDGHTRLIMADDQGIWRSEGGPHVKGK